MVTTAKDTPTTITLRFEELNSTILTNNPRSCLDSLSRPASMKKNEDGKGKAVKDGGKNSKQVADGPIVGAIEQADAEDDDVV